MRNIIKQQVQQQTMEIIRKNKLSNEAKMNLIENVDVMTDKIINAFLIDVKVVITTDEECLRNKYINIEASCFKDEDLVTTIKMSYYE